MGDRPWHLSKRQWATLVLLVLGIIFWLTQTGDRPLGWQGWIGAVLGLIIASVGALNRSVGICFTRIDRWVKSHTMISAAMVAITFAAYLFFEAHKNSGEMFLRIHDEHSYLIQARLLANGRLWTHGYPPAIAPFFDTFYLFVNPIYASMYFPGTALVTVPSIWLHLPYWTTPLLCGAGAVAVFFSIAVEIFDSLLAIVATLVLATQPFSRLLSLMLLSEIPVMFAILVLIWAWLRWRRHRCLRWAALVGAAAGWAGITRPLDAVSFAIPIAIAILFELRKQPARLMKTIAISILCLMPFAAVQIIQNIGITGKWSQFPEEYYHLKNFTVPAMGFGPYDLTKLPQGISAAKQKFAFLQLDLYQHRTLSEELAKWYSTRFIELRFVTLPSAMLIIFFPLALATMADIRRKVLVAGLLLFMVGYFICVYHLTLYMVPATPAVICIVLMGWQSLERAWPGQRRRIRPLMALTLAGMAVWQLPELNRSARPVLPSGEQLKQISEDCSALPGPSVVLFPFNEDKISLNSWPVFNDDVAWPDDARVIRVNDLGPAENWKLYNYYAQTQPNRQFYLYDRSGDDDPHPLKFLGIAADLAASHARN